MSIRVLIADDHPLLRQGVRSLLEAQPDMEVVGEAGDGNEAVAIALDRQPDVVLMDVSMPKADGLEATRRIREARPQTRVVVLTVHAEEEYVDGLLKAGAGGYLLKSTYGSNLVEAVRLASTGDMVLDSRVAKGLVTRAGPAHPAQAEPPQKAPDATHGLTHRELQLLRWVAQGATNADMAKWMGVSERTVKGYMARVFDKLEVSSRSAAVAAAMRTGILRSDEL